MGFVWETAVKDLRRHRRDPLSILLWIGIPLVVGGLIILAMGGGEGPRPKAHLLVADDDESVLSGLLIGVLSQDAAGGFIEAEETTREAGELRMERGEATALLVIPKGFADAVLLQEPATLRLVTNPAQTILPGMVEAGLTLLTDAVFYLQQLIGDDLRAFAEGPPEGRETFRNERIAEFSVRMNEMVDRLGEMLSPPLIAVETGPLPDAEKAPEAGRGARTGGSPEAGDVSKVPGVAPAPAGEGTVDAKAAPADDGAETAEPPDAEADVSPGVLLLPGILFMALLFMAQGLSADLWVEREGRTLRRAAVMPHSVHAFLAGKVVAALILIFGVSLVGLSIGFAYLSLGPRTLLPAAAWSTLSGITLVAMLTTVQVHASSRRMGGTLTMVVIFPLMMVGGSFFPFEAMPAWMAAVGRLTPNGWALEQLKAILLGRAEAAALARAAAGLLVVSALLFLAAGRRLRAAAGE